MEKSLFNKDAQKEGHISATPLPSPVELQKFYAELYFQSPQSSSYQNSYEEIELNFRRVHCDALLYALEGQGASKGNFLDIGAGEGFLMNAAHEKGYSVTGMDFSSFGVQKFFPSMSDQLISGDVFQSIAQLKNDKKKFDVCTSINVMEHVIDPSLFLSEIRGILSRKGILAITVPNDFSCLQQLLKKEGLIDRDFWFVPPQHLHYFNTSNLSRFCVSRGYEILDAFSDFPVDLFLLHPGSNYVMNSQNGPGAHRARMLHDLMIAQSGWDNYLNYYRAMFKVGIGRDITLILRPLGE